MFKNQVFHLKVSLLISIVILGFGVLLWMEPIAQDAGYHLFADAEKHLNIENMKNVLSNLFFVAAGFIGLVRIRRLPPFSTARMWQFFFWAILFVGFGSAYYHLKPDNNNLVWDRLPMTLGFTTLTSCIIAERISLKTGRILFLPSIAAGISSVFYWWLTENAGIGDLRPYILIQYLPMLLIPLILLLFPQKSNKFYWLLFVSYILAKIFELQDDAIFALTNMKISGHTLKHLTVGAGLLFFSVSSTKRQKETSLSGHKYKMTEQEHPLTTSTTLVE